MPPDVEGGLFISLPELVNIPDIKYRQNPSETPGRIRIFSRFQKCWLAIPTKNCYCFLPIRKKSY